MSKVVTLESHSVIAHNDSESHENKIHSDDVAQQYGFEGALVPGVTVIGHIMRVPVAGWGERIFTGTRANVRLLKPTYHQDRLTISGSVSGGTMQVECHNDSGVLLAPMTLETWNGDLAPITSIGKRPVSAKAEIATKNLHVGLATPEFTTTPDLETHLDLCELLGDTNSLYFDGTTPCVHPLWTFRELNSAFTRTWTMPVWIHVGTEITWIHPIRVGDEVAINMTPLTQWERKGHEFTTLGVTLRVGNTVCIDARHTAIYNAAKRT